MRITGARFIRACYIRHACGFGFLGGIGADWYGRSRRRRLHACAPVTGGQDVGQFGVGADNDDEDEVGCAGEGLVVVGGGDGQGAGVGSGDRGHGGVGEDLDAVALQLRVNHGREFGTDGGQNLGQRFVGQLLRAAGVVKNIEGAFVDVDAGRLGVGGTRMPWRRGRRRCGAPGCSRG